MNKVKQNGNSVLISMLTVSPNQKYLIFIFDSVVLLAGLIPPVTPYICKSSTGGDS